MFNGKIHYFDWDISMSQTANVITRPGKPSTSNERFGFDLPSDWHIELVFVRLTGQCPRSLDVPRRSDEKQI